METEIKPYSAAVRRKAIQEAEPLLRSFAARIRRMAVEKDRILRGDGMNFPIEHDFGTWMGAGAHDIKIRADGLLDIYSQEQPSHLKQGGSERVGDLIDPDSYLLQTVTNSPGIELDDTDIGPGLQPDSIDEETGAELITGDQIILAVDEVQKQILIEGISPLTSPTEYRIVSVLVRLFREDREAELSSNNFRTLSAADLAEAMGDGADQSGRKAISRLRSKINREHQELYGSAPGLEAVIENVRGKGYRINPSVRVVSRSQFRRSEGH